MAEIVQQITEKGLRLPRGLLEECGFEEGRHMLITPTSGGLLVRPAAASADEIVTAVLRHLLAVGDLLGVKDPKLHGGRWVVPVVLRPQGRLLGELCFDPSGTLLAGESATPSQLADAAEAS